MHQCTHQGLLVQDASTGTKAHIKQSHLNRPHAGPRDQGWGQASRQVHISASSVNQSPQALCLYVLGWVFPLYNELTKLLNILNNKIKMLQLIVV